MATYSPASRYPAVHVQLFVALLEDHFARYGLPADLHVDLGDKPLDVSTGQTVLQPLLRRATAVRIDVADDQATYELRLLPVNSLKLTALQHEAAYCLERLWEMARSQIWQHPDAKRFPQRLPLSVRQLRLYLAIDRLIGDSRYATLSRVRDTHFHLNAGDAFGALTRLGLITESDREVMIERNVMFDIVDAKLLGNRKAAATRAKHRRRRPRRSG